MARIALVAHWDWVVHNFRVAFAQRLREAGHDVTIVCPHGDHLADLRAAGFDPVDWRVERRGMRPWQERRSVAHLRALLAEIRPEVVQAFTIKPNLYAPLATEPSVPVMGLFSGLGWAFGPGAKAQAVRTVLGPVARRSLRQERVHLAVQNPNDRDLLVQHGWAGVGQVRVMPNGIDLPTFLRPPGQELRDVGPLRVLTACRLLRDKGVVELVGAVRQLAADGIDLEVTVAGGVDVGNPASLSEQDVRRLDSTPGVRFVGHVTDVASLLHQSDVAVLASSYNEGTPRFLLEAAAAGTALIGSDIPGVRRVIDHEDTGLLVPAADVAELAGALRRLHTDRHLLQSLASSAQARALADFSEDDAIAAYLDWYRETGVLDVAAS